MNDLTLKDHPLIFSVVPEEKKAVADVPVLSTTRVVSFGCGFPGCRFIFRITPVDRLDIDGVCDDRVFKTKQQTFVCVCVCLCELHSMHFV